VSGAHVLSRQESSRLENAAQDASPIKLGSADLSWTGRSCCLSNNGLNRLLSSDGRDGGLYVWPVLSLGVLVPSPPEAGAELDCARSRLLSASSIFK